MKYTTLDDFVTGYAQDIGSGFDMYLDEQRKEKMFKLYQGGATFKAKQFEADSDGKTWDQASAWLEKMKAHGYQEFADEAGGDFVEYLVMKPGSGCGRFNVRFADGKSWKWESMTKSTAHKVVERMLGEEDSKAGGLKLRELGFRPFEQDDRVTFQGAGDDAIILDIEEGEFLANVIYDFSVKRVEVCSDGDCSIAANISPGDLATVISKFKENVANGNSMTEENLVDLVMEYGTPDMEDDDDELADTLGDDAHIE